MRRAVSFSTSTPNRIDTQLLHQLMRTGRVLLGAVLLIAAAELAYWLWPHDALSPQSPLLLMKLNTALALLALAAAFCVDGTRTAMRRWPRALSAVAGTAVLLLALATLFEYLVAPPPWLDNLLVQDPATHLPGRMAWQTAIALGLLSTLLLLGLTPSRCQRPSRLIDLLLAAQLVLLLSISAGRIYGALDLYGVPTSVRTAPLTLLCLAALSGVLTVRRLPYSAASAFLGNGNAGHVGRVVLPVAIGLPLLLPINQWLLARTTGLEPAVAAALVATLYAVLAISITLWMTLRIDRFETDLQRLSLLDELTGVHNRRGLMLLARHALRGARREREAVSLIFIDLDGLKTINDQYGHDAGSEHIRAVAVLLENSFRDSDIIGRMGGDEFCVLAVGANAPDALRRVQQLEARVRDFNQRSRQSFAMSISVGIAQLDTLTSEGLERALHQADQEMYRVKNAKKQAAGGFERLAVQAVRGSAGVALRIDRAGAGHQNPRGDDADLEQEIHRNRQHQL